MFEVKRGLELPEANKARKPLEYPFALMGVGDGFDAPDDMGVRLKKNGKNGGSKRQTDIAAVAGWWAKRNNPESKFSTRKMDGFIRCVRVK